MKNVKKFNELLEEFNQKTFLENKIKQSLTDLTNSFTENFYFQIFNSYEYGTLDFRFYIPQKYNSDNDKEKKHFTEIEITNSFNIDSDDDYGVELSFNGFKVKIKQFSAPHDIVLSMMYGQEIKEGLLPAYKSYLVTREDMTDKAVMKSQSNENIYFIDFISQMNKDFIQPYLNTLTISGDDKNFQQNKEDKKEFMAEYNDIFDKLIHSLYLKKSLLNEISDNKIKEVNDLITEHSYIKIKNNLPQKEDKKNTVKI